jgi:hypothetical protein
VTVTCSNGHASTAVDYCDVCGTAIAPLSTAGGGSAAPSAPPPPPAPGAAGSGAAAAGNAAPPGAVPPKVGTPGVCPNCTSAYDGLTLFCEDCGYDFVLQAMPAAAAPVIAAAPVAAAGPPRWLVVVSVDREHYDRVADPSVAFPEGTPDRTVEVAKAESLIGRRSTSRNINPEIDCSVAPDDVAVSRRHATLQLADDGSLCLVDLDSSNGTRVNGGPDPIPPNQPHPLVDGDRVYVGAWTKLTVVDVR